MTQQFFRAIPKNTLGFSFFDLDHTLISKNSSFEFGKLLFSKGYISLFRVIFCLVFYSLHKVKLLSTAYLQKMIFLLIFRGKSYIEYDHLAQQLCDSVFQNFLNPSVYQFLKRAKKQGYCFFILSSSPDFLVDKFARKFACHGYLATSYQGDDRGNFTRLGLIIDGDEKATFVKKLCCKHRVSLENTEGFSDSILDINFLKVTASSFLINPSWHLKRKTKKFQWKYIDQ